MNGRIKIRVTEDCLGNVSLKPVSKRREAEVAATNAYDHCGDVYLQRHTDIEWFKGEYPKAYYGRGENKRINSGVVSIMDTWTYRQLVGGQSD